MDSPHPVGGHKVVLVGVLMMALVAGPARVYAEDCPPGWSTVRSPNGSLDGNQLGDVAVISANDIWAVGTTGTGLESIRTLTEHWNGSRWTVVPSPNGNLPLNFLSAVDGSGPNDVWAVGFTWTGDFRDDRSRTMVLHWDGVRWSRVPSPNSVYPGNRLLGVVALAPNNVWAVGNTYDYTSYRTLIMHWNGVRWSIVPSPNPRRFNFLYGIDAISANNIWAVGTQQGNAGVEKTLVLRWNGTSWNVVASPNVGIYGNNMLQVSAASANDIWAVGYHLAVFGARQVFQTSAFHYDGTRWSTVPIPDVNTNSNYLFDVVGLGPNDAWAVGFWDTLSSYETMVQHWDGARWTIRSSPSPKSATNELYAVDAVSASDLWAVGRTSDGLVTVDTLVERYGKPVCDGPPIHVVP